MLDLRSGSLPLPLTLAVFLNNGKFCAVNCQNISSTYSLVRSFARSLVRSFARSLVRSFARSLVRSFARSLVRSFARSLVPSFSYSLVSLVSSVYVQYSQLVINTWMIYFLSCVSDRHTKPFSSHVSCLFLQLQTADITVRPR